ncbi:hypothetical protein [Lentzea sp. NBRC 102530]|uniref:hypothetical protein n=1 Tax=Lentzea sp. NBRC 102530 TaxID=3032201 RepID=UPI0024A417A1|nr:hypothetical protein [Lentzea sp. NBRC 102530]GLY55145.1 membrane protein [Lentzea sp. NBRC 102530]
MSTVTESPSLAPALRTLYFVRFGFAIVWATLLFVTGSEIGLVSGTLLVLYPLFDVAAIVIDSRTSRGKASLALYANIAVSLAAAAGLAFAVSSGIPAVLRVWGAWAVVSGVAQLAVALVRRGMGGQWPMILSGGISTLAGTSFVLQAGAEGATLSNLAGYAAIGGVFFLVSALRLRR